MSKLVLLRHGQSKWNVEGKFTGHTDVELTEQGIAEAVFTKSTLEDIEFDTVFISPLKRTRDTAILALGDKKYLDIGGTEKMELIERDYGDLSGLTHKEAEDLHGKTQVNQWRNSYDVRPPNGECLKDVVERVMPFFNNEVNPLLDSDKNVLIVSHRNPIRAMVQHLDRIPVEKVDEIIIKTGSPIIYEITRSVKRIT